MKGKKKFFLLFLLFLWICPAMRASASDFYFPYDTDDKLIIVLDPGHGGKNWGANPREGLKEKDLNLKVAKMIAEELGKYEGITVYLTHEDAEEDVKIEDRAAFAAQVNADMLFCLHFNMSPGNVSYGSEVWISGFGEENRIGYGFGKLYLTEMRNLGLFIRGIKTRINDEGEDYYGILRYSTALGIPAVLIEHCHLDHEKDIPFYDSDEALSALAKTDAKAIAEFFCLKSKDLSVDYSANAHAYLIPATGNYAPMDVTEPDLCMIEAISGDKKKRNIRLRVTAADYDSPIQYYAYSLDGGENYSPYIEWPGVDLIEGDYKDTVQIDIPVPEDVETPYMKIKVANQYDLIKESNALSGFPVFETPEETVGDGESEGTEIADVPAGSETLTVSEGDGTPAGAGFSAPVKEQKERTDYRGFLKIGLIICIVLFIIVTTVNLVLFFGKGHKRKKKK